MIMLLKVETGTKGGSVQRFIVLSVQAHRKYLYFFFNTKNN
jgi:hypothetical protein